MLFRSVVGMNNLTVFSDFCLDFAPLIQRLEQRWTELKVSTFQGRHIEIPVIYGGELGQDLSEVAKLHNTTPVSYTHLDVYTRQMLRGLVLFVVLKQPQQALLQLRHVQW